MLYEVITLRAPSSDSWLHRAPAACSRARPVPPVRFHGTGRRNPAAQVAAVFSRGSPRVSQCDRAGRRALAEAVITSYSIHYTKLYEHPAALAGLGHGRQPFAIAAVEQRNGVAGDQPHHAEKVMRLLPRQRNRLPRPQRVIYIEPDLRSYNFV